MRRREVVAGLLGAGGWSAGLGAQQSVRGHRSARVGILNYAGVHYARVDDFRRSLRDLGYVEGRDLTIVHQ
jgi:hypothetical protein